MYIYTYISVYIYTYIYTYEYMYICIYGGYDSRLLKIIGLFCRISSRLQVSFAKETCKFKEPTNHSHPIVDLVVG